MVEPMLLDRLRMNDELALILELEDPARMSIERFQEVIHKTDDPIMQAYLHGLFDMRRVEIYAGAR